MECTLCLQVLQTDPRVVQLVTDLNSNLSQAAAASGDPLPAVLVLNKVSVLMSVPSNLTC